MHRYGLSDLVADHGGLEVFISEVAEAISSRGPFESERDIYEATHDEIAARASLDLVRPSRHCWLGEGSYGGCTFYEGSDLSFSESELRSDLADIVDLSARLEKMKPPLGGPRDDGVAVETLMCLDQVVCALAGIEAEKLICGYANASPHDRAEAIALASLVMRSRSQVAIDALVMFAEIEAAALLLDHVDVLRALADALLTHRTIDGDQIGAIMGTIS